MSLIKAREDSNAASKGASDAAESGELGMLGYTKVPFPGEMPARSNAEVGITSGSKYAAQQGTNMDSYKHQPAKPDAKTGS